MHWFEDGLGLSPTGWRSACHLSPFDQHRVGEVPCVACTLLDGPSSTSKGACSIHPTVREKKLSDGRDPVGFETVRSPTVRFD